MLRPCFLVVDRELPGSICTRKLVIETGKFNVISAYGVVEAIEALKRFPRVSGVVVDAGIRDMPCETLTALMKSLMPNIPIVVVSRPKAMDCAGADYHLNTFDPNVILKLLQKLEPKETEGIQQQDEALLDRGSSCFRVGCFRLLW